MANPDSLINNSSQRVDTAYDESGAGFYPLAVDDVDTTFTAHSARRGVASHKFGAAVSSGDGILVEGLQDPAGDAIPGQADAVGHAKVTAASGTLTDGSDDMTTGGTSQQVFAVNAARRYLFIQNLDAAEDLWINFTSNADIDTVGSIKLSPGQSYENPAHFCTTEKVTANATTTGHKYTAKEA